MSRQVLPQAPSPTMTSLRRISAIFRETELATLNDHQTPRQLEVCWKIGISNDQMGVVGLVRGEGRKGRCEGWERDSGLVSRGRFGA